MREPLVFYYVDVHHKNFMITKDREIYTVDFGTSGFLPISFVMYAFKNAEHKLAGQIASAILKEMPDEENLFPMGAVRNALIRGRFSLDARFSVADLVPQVHL